MLKEALGGWAGGICGVDQENDTSLRSINRLAAQLKDGPVLTSHRGFGLDDGLGLIRLKRIYNFLCSMLVFTPFDLCFVTLRGIFMRFPELTY
jgi:hypothetical protein